MDISYFVGYVSFFILGAWLVNVKTDNLFIAGAVVRASKGKRFLVARLNYGKLRYVIGTLEAKSLCYKKADGQKGRVTINTEYIYTILKNIDCVMIDDVKQTIIKPDGSSEVSIDIPTYENVVTRALTRPSSNEMASKVIKIMLIAVCGILLFVAWKLLTIEGIVKGLGGI